MKVTVRSARADKNGRHNDRNFDVNLAEHIDPLKVQDNMYYTYNGDYTHTFLESELEFYKEHFWGHVEAQNETYNKQGHQKLNKTIEDYHSSRNSRPEDVILQIGSIEEHASGEELWRCAMAYKDKFEELFGDHCKILNMALHLDEATPHVHIRRVWMAEDKYGQIEVNQTKALGNMDFLRPDNTKPNDKFNNSKVIFTATDKELFTRIAEAEGFMIDRTPSKRKRHLSKEEYIEFRQAEMDIDRLINIADNIIQQAMQDERLRQIYEEKVKALEQQSDIEKVVLAHKITEEYKQYLSERKEDIFDSRLNRIKSEERESEFEKFIEERGLKSDFDEWKKSSYSHSKSDERDEENSHENAADSNVDFF